MVKLSAAKTLLSFATVFSTSLAQAFPPNFTSQHGRFLQWSTEKEREIRNRVGPVTQKIQFEEPVYLPIRPLALSPVNPMEVLQMQQTADIYFQNFGKDTVESFLWSGIESGNPLTRNEEYRWNSLKEEGLYDSNNRKKIIQSLRQAGIRNIRLGMSNHEINVDNDASWNETSAMIDDFYQGGMRISLDLHHFGIEDRFRVLDKNGKTDGAKSYYLNPAWPEYFGRFARKAIEKYHQKIKAITIMNEPETVAGFNGEMWHGGFPGWPSPQTNKFYIQRSIQVGKASVVARLQIEDFLSKLPPNTRPKFIYMHTEASVHKTYWKEFNLYRRFIISDMILGNDWLLNADLDVLAQIPMDRIVGRWQRMNDRTRTILDWVIENYIVYNQQPSDREQLRVDLIKRLRELQDAHRLLASRFGKSMKTDTVLAVDYYSHNEDKDINGMRLNPEPQYYASEIRQGRRVGLYQVLVEYYNHFHLPVMIGESGTPYYYYGSRWTQQILLECAKAAKQGIPFLGYTLYPAVDTWGWESALSVPRSQALHNPSGIVDLSFTARPFIQPLVRSLNKQMAPVAPAKAPVLAPAHP